MAGLTAAHELVERGYGVTVYERKALGGKARSIGVPGTAAGGRRPAARRARLPLLPRLLPPRARHDAAHPVPRQRERRLGQPRRRPTATSGCAPATAPDGGPFGIGPDPDAGVGTVDGLRRDLLDEPRRQRRPAARARVLRRARCSSSSRARDERRFGQWEHVSWWDFIKAEGKSERVPAGARRAA